MGATATITGPQQLVAGEATSPAERLDGWLTDSDTGQRLAAQPCSSSETVDAALAAAQACALNEDWSSLPATERAATLRRLGEELGRRTELLAAADSLDSGAPLSTTHAIAEAVTAVFDYAAAQLEKDRQHLVIDELGTAVDQWRLPWGPAAVFVPWNAPTAIALPKAAEALAAGCPVIIKPSEWAPHFSAPLAQAVQAADLPPGLLQIVHGGPAMGSALIADDRVAAVSYTGGVSGGRAVSELCGRALKPADLELSGNNPAVILPGADLDEAVRQIVGGLLMLNGQWCAAPRRVFVSRDAFEATEDLLTRLLDDVVVGVTTDPSTQLGPMANDVHLRRLQDQIQHLADSGATVRTLGTPPSPESGGHFLQPTLVLDPPVPLREEVFGPVIALAAYRDLDDAVAQANDHDYGLAGFVFGRDREEARGVGRRIRAGLVKINRIDPSLPSPSGTASMWGQSGHGEIGGTKGIEFFTGARCVG